MVSCILKEPFTTKILRLFLMLRCGVKSKSGILMSKIRSKTIIKLRWLLCYIAATKFDGIVAWDSDTVDDFVKAFPEAERTLIVYTQGPNSSPMLNRIANIAYKLGYLSASSIGNQEARSYNRKTWCRYWVLTDKGKEFLKKQ